MKIITCSNWVILLMRDSHYFELELPNKEAAEKLASVIELAIADTIEQLKMEESDGPVRGN